MVNAWPAVNNSIRVQCTSQPMEGAQRAGEASVGAIYKGKRIRRKAVRRCVPVPQREASHIY